MMHSWKAHCTDGPSVKISSVLDRDLVSVELYIQDKMSNQLSSVECFAFNVMLSQFERISGALKCAASYDVPKS